MGDLPCPAGRPLQPTGLEHLSGGCCFLLVGHRKELGRRTAAARATGRGRCGGPTRRSRLPVPGPLAAGQGLPGRRSSGWIPLLIVPLCVRGFDGGEPDTTDPARTSTRNHQGRPRSGPGAGVPGSQGRPQPQQNPVRTGGHPRPWSVPLEHRELMAQDEDFDVLGSVAADSQAPSKATALRTSGRSASAPSADHVGLAWATMQQVNGCEHHFGHPQPRGRS